MVDDIYPVLLQSCWIHKKTLAVYTVTQLITGQFQRDAMPHTNVVGDCHGDNTILNLPLEEWQKQLMPILNQEIHSRSYYMYQTQDAKREPTEEFVEVEFIPEDIVTVDCYGDVESSPYDVVKKPSHYSLSGLDNRTGLQWMHVLEELLNRIPEGIPYVIVTEWSESITYLARMWNKNGLEDAEKSLFYLQSLIQKMKDPSYKE
jgi:hypothetical protein